jgi:hypothetical protein
MERVDDYHLQVVVVLGGSGGALLLWSSHWQVSHFHVLCLLVHDSTTRDSNAS